MPNNILVGSEKLFRTKAPWKIERSLLGQMTKDHEVLLFEYDPSEKTHSKMAKQIARRLYDISQREYNKMIFIGLESDCRVASELHQLGFRFDAVVLINNIHAVNIFDKMLPTTAIYNFSTGTDKDMLYINGAECNQLVKTFLPAHMSNRLATEIAGCVLYQTYEQTYLSNVAPKFISI